MTDRFSGRHRTNHGPIEASCHSSSDAIYHKPHKPFFLAAMKLHHKRMSVAENAVDNRHGHETGETIRIAELALPAEF